MAGLFDSDGCISASCTAAGSTIADAIFDQSNPACLFAIAHTLASLGLSIRHAKMCAVNDPKTGRYTHRNKVHILVYKGAAAATLASLLQYASCMRRTSYSSMLTSI